MNKVLILLLVLLTACSSAFAKCNLDMNRWKYLGSSSNYSVYFDTVSLLVNEYKSSFEVWSCWYYPGGYSNCADSQCEEKGIHTSEHYHYYLEEFNYRERTSTFKSAITRDNLGKAISSVDMPSILQQAHKLSPDSSGEFIMQNVKEYIDNPTPLKPESKIEEHSTVKSVYKVGDKGWKIKQAKQYLLKLGFEPGEINGVFTQSTHTAIRKFQKKYSLKETGNLDNATYEELEWQAEAKDYD